MTVNKIHHLNCGTLCSFGGACLFGKGPPHFVCHCLLVETNAGLVLIETGLGTQDVVYGQKRLGRLFTSLSRPVLSRSECALRQVEALGYQGKDVRDILVTQLDLDHAGGIADFPHANIHIYGKEYRHALKSKASRYVQAQFKATENWVLYDEPGEEWFGFESVQPIEGLLSDLVIIPLTGHTPGHAGIAVRQDNGWLLHCGDAYFHRDTVHSDHGKAPFLLRMVEAVNQTNAPERIANQLRLRGLVQSHRADIQVFCAHDAVEYGALAGTP